MVKSKEYSPFKRGLSNKNASVDVSGVLRVVLIYAAFSAIYILLSDQALHWLVSDPELITQISIIKGWGFVAITSMLLYELIRRLLQQGLEAVQEQEQGYRDLAERSLAIIYQASIDAESKTLYVSPRVTELGYPPQAWIDTPNLWRTLIHPEDVERVLDTLKQSHENKTVFSSEYRLKTKNGQWRYFYDEASVVHDAHGNPLYLQGMMLDITDRKKAEETIHNLAFYDALTGLPNRKLLLNQLKKALPSSPRKKYQGAMLFIDIDDFKLINDIRGHDVGDLLLIEVAKRIQSCIHSNDTLARFGSNEFAVLLDALNHEIKQAALQTSNIAERIHHAIKQPFDLQGQAYYCKACIGISLFNDQETSFDELLKRADAALSQAKETGRDKIHFFDNAMQAALEARVNLESWLRVAIPDQLRLFYQIQVDENGHAFGAEALIRWEHPEKGIIPPVEFIPLAEETGLILPIGRWVIEAACKQIKTWETNAKTRHLILAINVSAKQFHQLDFVDQVLDALNQTEADPTRLKLELTESLLVENVEVIIEKMTALKQKGVRFSLDDFGTGFSSLSYLKRLPLDQLKIDQSFVRDINTDPNDAAIVRTVITLGQSLGLDVIAEGVETQAQKDFLAKHGCVQYQGYLFGKPVALADFEKLLQRH